MYNFGKIFKAIAPFTGSQRNLMRLLIPFVFCMAHVNRFHVMINAVGVDRVHEMSKAQEFVDLILGKGKRLNVFFWRAPC